MPIKTDRKLIRKYQINNPKIPIIYFPSPKRQQTPQLLPITNPRYLHNNPLLPK